MRLIVFKIWFTCYDVSDNIGSEAIIMFKKLKRKTKTITKTIGTTRPKETGGYEYYTYTKEVPIKKPKKHIDWHDPATYIYLALFIPIVGFLGLVALFLVMFFFALLGWI